MKRTLEWLLAVGLMLGVIPTRVGAQVMETQAFDSAALAASAGWAALGNTQNGNSFGFSLTNNTGGASPSGEAGGTFARTANLAYYADLTIGGSPTLNYFLQASGELAVTSFAFNNGIRIGFFDRNDISGPIDFAGFLVAEPVPSSTGQPRVFAGIHLSDGALLEASGSPPTLAQGLAYSWTMNWNPTTYQLAFELFNSGGVSQGINLLNLDAMQVAAGANLNAFGIFTGGLGGANPLNVVDVWTDNLTYSFTPVPEPSSIVLCGLAIAGLYCQRRRTRRAAKVK